MPTSFPFVRQEELAWNGR